MDLRELDYGRLMGYALDYDVSYYKSDPEGEAIIVHGTVRDYRGSKGYSVIINIQPQRVVIERRSKTKTFWKKDEVTSYKWNEKYKRFDIWTKRKSPTNKRFYWTYAKPTYLSLPELHANPIQMWAERYRNIDASESPSPVTGFVTLPRELFFPMPGYFRSIEYPYRYPSFELLLQNRVRRKLPKDVKKFFAEKVLDETLHSYPITWLHSVPTKHWRDILTTEREPNNDRAHGWEREFVRSTTEIRQLLAANIPENRLKRILKDMVALRPIAAQYMVVDISRQLQQARPLIENGELDIGRARTLAQLEELLNGHIRRGARLNSWVDAPPSDEPFKDMPDSFFADDYEIVFPQNEVELVEWSDTFHNCVRGYANNIRRGEVVGAVRQDGEMLACFQSVGGTLHQLLGKYNQTLPEDQRQKITGALAEANLHNGESNYWGA